MNNTPSLTQPGAELIGCVSHIYERAVTLAAQKLQLNIFWEPSSISVGLISIFSLATGIDFFWEEYDREAKRISNEK